MMSGQRQEFVHGGVEVGGVFPQRQAQVDVEGDGGPGGAEFGDGGAVCLAHRAGDERDRAVVQDVARLRGNVGEVFRRVEHIRRGVAVEGELALAAVVEGDEGQRGFRRAAAFEVAGIDPGGFRRGGDLRTESVIADLAQDVAFAAELGVGGGDIERRTADGGGVVHIGSGFAATAGNEIDEGFTDGIERHVSSCGWLWFAVMVAIGPGIDNWQGMAVLRAFLGG